MSKDTPSDDIDQTVTDAEHQGDDEESQGHAESAEKRKDVIEQLRVLTRSHEDDGGGEGASLWLITFTDIMALMLTFFVLLYSMSVPEVDKWEEITSSINKGISRFYSPEHFSGAQETISITKLRQNKALNLNYLYDPLKTRIDKNELLQGVEIIVHKNQLTISMPEDLLFEVADDQVKERGQRALFALAEILTHIRNRIEIIGHSDPRPINDNYERFESNWDLSLSRALQVSGVLAEAGYRRDMTVRGMSSARYDEIPPSVAEDVRLDLSRRVDIVIMKDDGRIRSFLEFGRKQ